MVVLLLGTTVHLLGLLLAGEYWWTLVDHAVAVGDDGGDFLCLLLWCWLLLLLQLLPLLLQIKLLCLQILLLLHNPQLQLIHSIKSLGEIVLIAHVIRQQYIILVVSLLVLLWYLLLVLPHKKLIYVLDCFHSLHFHLQTDIQLLYLCLELVDLQLVLLFGSLQLLVGSW